MRTLFPAWDCGEALAAMVTGGVAMTKALDMVERLVDSLEGLEPGGSRAGAP